MTYMIQASEVNNYINGKPAPRYEAMVNRLRENNRVRLTDLLWQNDQFDMMELKMLSYKQNLDNCTNAEQSAPEGGNPMAKDKLRYPVGRDENGKFITKQVEGKNDSERVLAAVDKMFASGFLQKERPGYFAMPVVMPPAPKVYHPFKNIADEWLNVECPRRVERGKLCKALWTGGYTSNFNNHVLPYFEDWNIEDIQWRHIQEFVYSLVDPRTEEFYAKSTIKQIATVLKQILDYAEEMDYIAESPWKKGKLDNPSDKESTRTPLTKAEYINVRSQIPTLRTEQERLWLTLFGYLPYRPSEAYGQRWEDICFSDKPTCKVTGTVVREDGQTVYYKGRGKNKQSLRTMVATPEMMEALAPYRKDSGFVLNNNGAHFTRTDMENTWHSIKKQIPLLEEKGITPYCFRHTYATIMYHETKNMVLVAAQCGHINDKITKEVYTHDDMEYRRAAVAQLEAALT